MRGWGRDQFEAAVGKKAIVTSPPRDRVAEKAGDPESETKQIFERQEQPVDSSAQNKFTDGVSRENANEKR